MFALFLMFHARRPLFWDTLFLWSQKQGWIAFFLIWRLSLFLMVHARRPLFWDALFLWSKKQGWIGFSFFLVSEGCLAISCWSCSVTIVFQVTEYKIFSHFMVFGISSVLVCVLMCFLFQALSKALFLLALIYSCSFCCGLDFIDWQKEKRKKGIKGINRVPIRIFFFFIIIIFLKIDLLDDTN